MSLSKSKREEMRDLAARAAEMRITATQPKKSTSSSSNRAGPSIAMEKKKSISPTELYKSTKTELDKFTKAHCVEFFNNPRKNPMTDTKFTRRYTPTFNDIVNKCKTMMREDDFLKMCEIHQIKPESVKDFENYKYATGLRSSTTSSLFNSTSNSTPRSSGNQIDKCKAFLKNPTRDPFNNNKSINMDSEEFDAIYKRCQEIMTPETVNEYIETVAEQILPDNYNGAIKFRNMLANVTYDLDEYNKKITNVKVGNIFKKLPMERLYIYYLYIDRIPKMKEQVSIDNPIIKALLKRGGDILHMKLIIHKYKIERGILAPINPKPSDRTVRYTINKIGNKSYQIEPYSSDILSLMTSIEHDFINNIPIRDEMRQRLLSEYKENLKFLLNHSAIIEDGIIKVSIHEEYIMRMRYLLQSLENIR